jgi:hypothetical protein
MRAALALPCLALPCSVFGFWPFLPVRPTRRRGQNPWRHRGLRRLQPCRRQDGRRDLTGAGTSVTSFLGTDRTKVKGLTQKQLNVACGDATTKLPPGLKIHTCQ